MDNSRRYSTMLDYILLVAREYVVAFAVLIVLVVLTFLLLIFLPKPKCYFDTSVNHELNFLAENEQLLILQEEIIRLLDVRTADEKNYTHVYADGMLRTDISRCEKSYALFRTIPYVRRITLVKLLPKTKLNNSKGSAELANNTLRCVLPLKVSGAQMSGIWVDGESKFYTEGQWIIYDNSREHAAYNEHKRLATYLLIIDIDRPSYLPIGIAIEENDLVI